MNQLEVHPEAYRELEEAKRWYEGRSTGLGTALMREIDSAIEAIRESPDTWLPYVKGTRRFLLHRFPFAIIYYREGDIILILAYMHCRRRPGYWLDRLSSQ